MDNIMAEAVSPPGGDIVGEVAAEGRLSGKSYEQRGADMNSTKHTARIAGVLYLVNGVTGFFGIIYVPGRLMVPGNAAATVQNILASERFFRLGIVSAN